MADNRNKVTKYRRPLNLNIGMLIFAAILIYVLIGVFMYFKTEHIVGYSVKKTTLDDNSHSTSNDQKHLSHFLGKGQVMS